MESKISEANSHIIILVCEKFTLMAISCVYNLFFKGHMESKISEANSQAEYLLRRFPLRSNSFRFVTF